jgi:hypothetical protein
MLMAIQLVCVRLMWKMHNQSAVDVAESTQLYSSWHSIWD